MKTINFEFVECIPDVLEEGTVYVSLKHCVAIHKCCCGCHKEVVTPFSPTDWKLIFDGKSISLYPSIGNWNFPCRSHYWITNNNVVRAKRWTEKQIKRAREHDLSEKEKYFDKKKRNSLFDSIFRKKKNY